jgi:hypothetical protein
MSRTKTSKRHARRCGRIFHDGISDAWACRRHACIDLVSHGLASPFNIGPDPYGSHHCGRRPAICLVEITCLSEKGRLPAATAERIADRLSQPDSGLLVAPPEVAEHVAKIPREQIPDMPDRIIAATASLLGLPLLTKDGRIRSGVIEE